MDLHNLRYDRIEIQLDLTSPHIFAVDEVADIARGLDK